MNVGNIVKIEDNNEWKGMYGIIRYIHGDEAYVFCVQMPCYLYRVTKNNNIVLVN
ncbi:hypothetical protein IAI10_14845 [Clostridium sp. 19966]|uniref:hypothetical protein n=1 Tax=Clostridium sp. 19966 TaxID=2768166 RepID=UPI0028DD4743|nr:hypothetical protein [Clostridium sp. 19966]MDT8717940.1 hypothetical protein [Clostridium sp. 19966]